jgi:hypothetical protein
VYPPTADGPLNTTRSRYSDGRDLLIYTSIFTANASESAVILGSQLDVTVLNVSSLEVRHLSVPLGGAELYPAPAVAFEPASGRLVYNRGPYVSALFSFSFSFCLFFLILS